MTNKEKMLGVSAVIISHARLVELVVRDLPILLGFTHCRVCVDAVGCLALHSNRAGLVDLGYQ